MLLTLKALHIIGFVAWFGGMFYLVRMFVYHVEALQKTDPERSILTKQFHLMEWRAYNIIMNPAMMITWTAGLAMLILGLFTDYAPNYLSTDIGTPGWMHLKLTLLVGLTIYHVFCKRLIKQLETESIQMDSFQLRLFNEVPTLFLAAIVFIAVFGKMGQLSYPILLGGLVLFAGLMYWGARAYRKRRSA